MTIAATNYCVIHLPIIFLSMDISPFSSPPTRTCWCFKLFQAWTCGSLDRWTGTVVWRHQIPKQKWLQGFPVTWVRTLHLKKCRAGVMSLLQWVCSCRQLTRLRRLSHLEGAGITLQSFWREQGDQKEEYPKWVLLGGGWRGPWAFLRTPQGVSPLKRLYVHQDDCCTIRWRWLSTEGCWCILYHRMSRIFMKTLWANSTKDVMASFFI